MTQLDNAYIFVWGEAMWCLVLHKERPQCGGSGRGWDIQFGAN